MTQPRTPFRKATYSQTPGSGCVEVASDLSTYSVRDSKDRSGPTLTFDASDWMAFLTLVK